MENMVLYRKYRPQSFFEIIGQEHIVQTLVNSLKGKSISHAYLFAGPKGSGKTTIARIFAKAINCQNNSDFEPCNRCSSCQDIALARNMDLMEIDAASQTSIDNIRELTEGIKFAPVQSKYKVFIIDECLTGEHLVSMADGRVKKISEIENGDKILSVDINTGSIIEGVVSNYFSRNTNELIELKTPQTCLKVTPSHKLWVIRNGEFILIEARNLKLNDFLLSPVSLPHRALNTLTPDYLSFMALIQCDGHISKDSITIQVEVRKDQEYFERIFKRGLSAWGIKEKPVITRTIRGTKLLRIYSKKLKEDLIQLGCPPGKKGSKIDVPDVVFQAPLESIRSYIDTCFCCEVNVDFDKKRNLYRLHFTSTSELFSKKVQILLKKFSIASSYILVHKEKKDKNHSVQHRLTLSHKDVKIFCEKIGLSLSRKNKLIQKCAQERAKTDTMPIMDLVLREREENGIFHSDLNSAGIWLSKGKNLSRLALANFMQISALPVFNKYLNFRYEKIKRIKELKTKEKVYDFTVGGTHTFIVNGICSSNCHQLSKSAANALLKTLEEPPNHAVFILATTEGHKMIPTIISRCQRFDFRRLKGFEIIKKLEFILNKEKIKFEKQVLPLVAFNARGSLRDAESLLDKCIGFAGQNATLKTKDVEEMLGLVQISQIAKLIDFLVAKKGAKEAILHINSMADEGIDLQEFAKALVFYLRQMLLLKINPEFLNVQDSGFSDEEIERIKIQSSGISEKEIQNMMELFLETENKMKYSSITQLPLELAVIDICLPS